MSMHDVLYQIAGERRRQDEKWGADRDIPDFGFSVKSPSHRAAEWYGVPSEAAAKHLCNVRFGIGVGSYGDILVEEVSEALSTATKAELRAELIQVAAVAVAWIEKLDREAEAEKAL